MYKVAVGMNRLFKIIAVIRIWYILGKCVLVPDSLTFVFVPFTFVIYHKQRYEKHQNIKTSPTNQPTSGSKCPSENIEITGL